MTPGDDPALDEAIHRADLDALVRLIDARCESSDWEGVLRVRDRSRHALDTGRQLWPAATLAEYRLALLAPASQAATVLDEGSGRFTIGPLTEVVAQHHTWAELGALLEPGPRAALVAHERALRGEAIDGSELVDVLEIPYVLAPWEPGYCLATYRDASAEFPAPPDAPGGDEVTCGCAASRDGELFDDAVGAAARDLVEPWTASSNGHCDVVAVQGSASAALAALGVRTARLAPLALHQALRWMAWAGASGGAFGRRRGAALGRFGAWWLLAALTRVEWPPDPDELGAAAAKLRWWWFDAGEPAVGWRLQLCVEDPAGPMAWAISAADAA